MSHVHVRMTLGRLRLEFDGDETLFARIVEPLVLQSAQGRAVRGASPPAASSPETGAGTPADRRPAPEETRRASYVPPSDRFGLFQRQMGEVGDGSANRIAAYAFFLWNYERKEVFSEDEVLGCFVAGGADPPDDATAQYQDLVERRILAPGSEDGTWRLTAKGKAHVRHHLLSA